MHVLVGTAGWSIPSAHADALPGEGPHLARYAARFGAVEINSSFHRPHRRSTYARWAASVTPGFRFAVKLPKTITHDARLIDTEPLIARFVEEVSGLGDARGPTLVQLPPSLAFDPAVAHAFFVRLRDSLEGSIVCEPRHASWFGDEADSLLSGHRVARVAADPAKNPGAAEPGGWRGLAYFRLHGSPVIYRSSYGEAAVEAQAKALAELARAGVQTWTIYDNTASGAAMGDALMLLDRIGVGREESVRSSTRK